MPARPEDNRKQAGKRGRPERSYSRGGERRPNGGLSRSPVSPSPGRALPLVHVATLAHAVQRAARGQPARERSVAPAPPVAYEVLQRRALACASQPRPGPQPPDGRAPTARGPAAARGLAVRGRVDETAPPHALAALASCGHCRPSAFPPSPASRGRADATTRQQQRRLQWLPPHRQPSNLSKSGSQRWRQSRTGMKSLAKTPVPLVIADGVARRAIPDRR
jgi:hypothetical protein